MSDEPADDDGPVKVVFLLRRDVYERMWTAAAREGISFTAVLNSYVRMFDKLATTPPNTFLKVTDREGKVLRMYILRNDYVEPPRERRRRWWHRFNRG